MASNKWNAKLFSSATCAQRACVSLHRRWYRTLNYHSLSLYLSVPRSVSRIHDIRCGIKKLARFRLESPENTFCCKRRWRRRAPTSNANRKEKNNRKTHKTYQTYWFLLRIQSFFFFIFCHSMLASFRCVEMRTFAPNDLSFYHKTLLSVISRITTCTQQHTHIAHSVDASNDKCWILMWLSLIHPIARLLANTSHKSDFIDVDAGDEEDVCCEGMEH